MQLFVIFFGAAILVQLIFLICFLIGLSRKRLTTSSTQEPVSVIVCAHDEEEHLRELIPLLQSQNYPEFEIIVINDRSNDGTYDLLLDEMRKDPRVRMVNVDRVPPHVNGKKYGLTLGIKAAKYDQLLLTDADCRPDGENWIASMSAAFSEKTQFVLGMSPYQKTGGFLNLFIRFETLLTAIQYSSFALLKNPYMGVGRNLAYRKSTFLSGKGFHELMNVTGGDDDLYVNQHATGTNTEVVLLKEGSTSSFAEKSWGAFFKQKRRHLSVGKLYKFKHRFLLGLLVGSWILSWLLLVPATLWAFTPYLPAGLMAFRIIMLIAVFNKALKRMGHKFELWTIPFLDFLFSIYYLTAGLTALGSKKVRWKN